MAEMTTTNSLFSLAPLRLTHRRLISRTPGTASLASTVPGPGGGAGSGLLSVLDRALTNKERRCHERAQVRRKGMEAERSAVEGIQVRPPTTHARHAHVLLLLIPHYGAHKLFEVKMTVVLGELGGSDEYSLLESLKQGKVEKPVVARGAMSALKRIKDFRSWLRKEIFRLSPRLHPPPPIPEDLKTAIEVGRSELLQFISTISDDREF
ncbi:hypothetical protein VPH35_085125 [Triticum aestivum]